jgi:hypothetical protein
MKYRETEKLYQALEAWHNAKMAEKCAEASRREAEDRIIELTGLRAEEDGVDTVSCGNLSVSVSRRAVKKVDYSVAAQIAAEEGLADQFSYLFRLKAEINTTAWKTADKNITSKFSPAVTTTMGRPSFTTKTKGE